MAADLSTEQILTVESEAVARLDRPISSQIADILCRDTFSRDSRYINRHVRSYVRTRMCMNEFLKIKKRTFPIFDVSILIR